MICECTTGDIEDVLTWWKCWVNWCSDVGHVISGLFRIGWRPVSHVSHAAGGEGGSHDRLATEDISLEPKSTSVLIGWGCVIPWGRWRMASLVDRTPITYRYTEWLYYITLHLCFKLPYAFIQSDLQLVHSIMATKSEGRDWSDSVRIINAPASRRWSSSVVNISPNFPFLLYRDTAGDQGIKRKDLASGPTLNICLSVPVVRWHIVSSR